MKEEGKRFERVQLRSAHLVTSLNPWASALHGTATAHTEIAPNVVSVGKKKQTHNRTVIPPPPTYSLGSGLHTWNHFIVTPSQPSGLDTEAFLPHRKRSGWAPARSPRPCSWRCRCSPPHPAWSPPLWSFPSRRRWSCTSLPPPEPLYPWRSKPLGLGTVKTVAPLIRPQCQPQFFFLRQTKAWV